MGEELPRSGVYGSRGRALPPLPPRALLILFAFRLILAVPPFPCRLLLSPFRLLRRSLFRHRPVGSLLSLWRLGLEQAPGSRGAVFKSAFIPFLQCKNAHPEITPNLSAPRLRFKISLSSIDPYPPFHAKRPVKASDTLAPEKWSHFYISEPPPRAPGPG